MAGLIVSFKCIFSTTIRYGPSLDPNLNRFWSWRMLFFFKHKFIVSCFRNGCYNKHSYKRIIIEMTV